MKVSHGRVLFAELVAAQAGAGTCNAWIIPIASFSPCAAAWRSGNRWNESNFTIVPSPLDIPRFRAHLSPV